MTGSWALVGLTSGLGRFVASHGITWVPAWRSALVRKPGNWRYIGLFALAGGGGLGIAVASAPQLSVRIWHGPGWGREAALALLAVGLFLVARGAYLPGRMRRLVRHPMLWGAVLLSTGHLVASGQLGAVLLFGAVGVFSLAPLAAGRAVPSTVRPGSAIGFDLTPAVLAFGAAAGLVAVHGALTGRPIW